MSSVIFPGEDLRTNLATWAVLPQRLPAVARVLQELLPHEPYDPQFRGQYLETTYLDTSCFSLRAARRRRNRYLTLRVRCYRPYGSGEEAYALSAKTGEGKFRVALAPATAEVILAGGFEKFSLLLPADLLGRLFELTENLPLLAVARVRCVRYAVEDDKDRLTLDCNVHTDTGKRLAAAVLEFKSMYPDPAPEPLVALGLPPIKLSKFLWATKV
jgi:hypothetical protein